MEAPLHILIIDDSDDDRMLCRRALMAAFGERLSFEETTTGEAALDVINTTEPSCVLLDYSLPGRNGLEVLKRVRDARPYLPVVMLTGQGNEAVAVQSMKEGAQDYISKAAITPEHLSRSVRMAIETSALQKRIEDQRLTVELFNHALAHDLREPVRTVRSFAAIVCDGEVGDETRDEYMSHIRDAGDRMEMLIDSVSAYTELEGRVARSREVFRLNEAASDAAANLSVLFAERGVTVMIPGNLPSVAANRIQVTQLLQSLMSNAVSHNPDPVRIGLEARYEETLVRVAVSDNGSGIAPENQRRIFEPFQRLNHDNHHCGLGLAIAEKIVEAHGGKIGCDSIPGEGSSFHFTLPGGLLTVEPPVIVAPAASRSGVESETLANVLFVDDSEAEIELAQFYLTASDGMRCNLLIARDGKEGLAMIRDQESRNDPVDLVLLDVNMPVMNGFQMLEAMAKDALFGPVPVVMCSGSSREEDKSRAHALGAIAYLVKTVRFAQLEPVIADVAGVRLIRDEEGARSLVRVG